MSPGLCCAKPSFFISLRQTRITALSLRIGSLTWLATIASEWRVWGARRSEIKEEKWAQPISGDIRGVVYPAVAIPHKRLSETGESKSHPPVRNVV
jgi:hypothetical protein